MLKFMFDEMIQIPLYRTTALIPLGPELGQMAARRDRCPALAEQLGVCPSPAVKSM